MRKIVHNRARCLVCGDVLTSTHRHDFQTCQCGNLSVDGGHDYIRRGFQSDKWENMNVTAPDLMPHYLTGPGWWAMLDRALTDMYDADPDLTRVSVDEKYGKVRLNCYTTTETRHDLLAMHEETIVRESSETCELCGAPGSIRNDRGWYQCRCDRCHAATREEQKEIMRSTAAEYRQKIAAIEARLPSDADPTEREAAYLRAGMNNVRATEPPRE